MPPFLRFYLFALLLAMASCSTKPKADIILYNGTIYTVDSSFSIVNTLVIKNGKIIAAGDDALREQFSCSHQVNLNGRFVYPGFIDAHCHFYGYSTDLPKCALFGTTSFDEIVQRLAEYEKQNTFSWLLARGWDQNDWNNKTYPEKTVLDSLFPKKPVFLMRIDGHAALVNQAALDLAGITANTKIKGGEIILKGNKPTGLLIDNAVDLVKNLIPAFTPDIKQKGLMDGQHNCFAVGLTTVVDAGLKVSEINFLDSLQQSGKLKMNIYAMAELTDESKAFWFKKGKYKTALLEVSSFKLYADGALGSRGACLLKPYADQPGHYGFLLKDTDVIKNLASEVYNHGFQLNTHCIGDSANRFILSVYGSILQTKNDRRWRIEHCQVVNPDDLNLFNQYSIIPSVQPTHATSDMYWAESRLGEDRIAEAYAYASLLSKAGMIADGSDFPVESINPLFGFYAAVTRKDQKGFPKEGFMPEQKLNRTSALKATTIWAAYSIFQEKERGSLEVGKYADLVVLPSDLMTAPDSVLFQIPVFQTYSKGNLVYENKK